MPSRMVSAAGSAAATDLGLSGAGGPGSPQNLTNEEVKRRKQLQKSLDARQKTQGAAPAGGPFSGAFMSLTGNQY